MQKYEGKVAEIKQETPNVKTFKVTFPGVDEFTFIAGQFFMISIPGFVNDSGVPRKRAYSIASAPLDKGYVEFTITAKSPKGLSTRMHQLKVGDTIELQGPAGNFLLKEGENMTFISGGSGISSLRAMYRQLLLSGYEKPVTLLAGFHSKEDYIYETELSDLEEEYPNFKVIPAMTTDPEWEGARGRVTEVIPKVFKDAKSRTYFICGSPEMVEDTIKVLTEMGVPRHQINREVW